MNNISYSDFQNICRMCMLSCDIKFARDNIITDVFYKLTDMHFETNDELPQQICLKCFDKVNEIHEFAFQCKRTHSSLLKCINIFKNAQICEERETEEINEPFKTEEEITIGEHKIDFLKDEVLNSTSEYVNDEIEIKQEIEEDKNVEFEEIMIPGTSGEQNINCTKDELMKQNTLNIEVKNEEVSSDNVNLNDSIEDTYSSDFRESSYIDLSENKEEPSKKIKQKHKRVHRGERPYKCEQCSKLFRSLTHINNHMRVHSGERPFKCEHCSKTYTQSNHLKEHIRRHTGERLYQCKKCSKSYIRSTHLKIHMRTHNGKRSFKCKPCSKSFTQSAELKIHMWSTHNSVGFYKCGHVQCTKSYTRSADLKIHQRTHSVERPFKCEKCSKSFIRSADLQKHMLTHSGERPFQCNQCSKSFSQSGSLKMHMRVHSGERPFQCEHCSKAFSQSISLKSHMRTHTGERPYKCEHCPKSFSQTFQLNRHMLTHSGERPYQCERCSKVFSRSDTLKRHLRVKCL